VDIPVRADFCVRGTVRGQECPRHINCENPTSGFPL
jgi:hypothetical protein